MHGPVERTPETPPARHRAGRVLTAAVAAVLLATAVVAVAVRGDREGDVRVVDPTAVVWPFPGSTLRFDDPVDVAREFALAFLRFDAPLVGTFDDGAVAVQPTTDGPVTRVEVGRVAVDGPWAVVGASTADIEITEPAAGSEVASPVHVTGRAVAFEGTVQVEVRQDGELGAIGAGFVTGGGDVPRPFSGDIPFETAGAPAGALVLFTTSAEDGRMWEAAVVRVRLRSTDVDAAACDGFHSPRAQPDEGEMEVKAYFNCDPDGGGVSLHPVYRAVPSTTAVLTASLEALLAGPDETERRAGLGSWFSAATADLLRSVSIRDGHAVVDFGDLRPVIPSASASAGSALLLSQLDATVFQFRSVESVEYRIDGSCEAFTEWLQFGGCEPRTRAEVSTD